MKNEAQGGTATESLFSEASEVASKQTAMGGVGKEFTSCISAGRW
jgi:hypothetical protein